MKEYTYTIEVKLQANDEVLADQKLKALLHALFAAGATNADVLETLDDE